MPTRRPFPLNYSRRAPSEHHGCRVSIKREEVTEEGTRFVEVQALRGGMTPRDLDGYAFWWIDRWTEAEPGVLFTMVLAETGEVVRSRMPPDYPAIPLPETSAEYQDKVRAGYLEWERNHEAEVDRRARVALEACDRMLECGREMRAAGIL